jgi:hypothetical protein
MIVDQSPILTPHVISSSSRIRNLAMYGKNRHRRSHTQPTRHHSSSSDNSDFVQTGFDGLKAIAMTIFCLDPANSSSDDSPHATPSRAAYIPSATHQPFKLPLPKSFETIIQAETVAREQMEKTHHDELVQTEALFCVTTEKQAINEAAFSTMAQQFFLPHVLVLREQIEKEEADLRAEMEMVFDDDAAVKVSGNDFDEVSNPSEPRFFQSAANAAEPKEEWVGWALGR